jgi:transposase-like protein
MNIQTRTQAQPIVTQRETKAFVYCPICTHTVEGIVVTAGKTAKVKPGQKCTRCSAALDPAYIMRMDRAA